MDEILEIFPEENPELAGMRGASGTQISIYSSRSGLIADLFE
jgi:hypothetical protein